MDELLHDQTDEELCKLALSGIHMAEEVLVTRYRRLVRVCARPLFLAGGDSEDLLQEGMIGLLAAIREFDPKREAGFHTYAEVCIRNRLRSAVKMAARNKHTPLNHSLSLDTDDPSDHRRQQSPEEILIDREAFAERMELFSGELSDLEYQVLRHYLDGLSSHEIAQAISRPPKSVDNAVQRIRRKLARHLAFGEFSES